MDQELFARFRKCAVEVLSVEEDAVVPELWVGHDGIHFDREPHDGTHAEAGEQFLKHGVSPGW